MRDNDTAAVLGLLAGAIPGAKNYFNNLDRELSSNGRSSRNAERTARDAEAKLLGLLGRGDILRGLFPSVQDFEAGLAMASYKKSAGGLLVPSQGTCARPLPVSEAEVDDYTYPPALSDYDSKMLMSGDPGEMVDLGHALTFPEVRSMVVGMVQDAAPTPAGNVQVHRAFKQMVKRLVSLSYTPEGYEAVWKGLFPKTEAAAAGAVVNYARLIDIVQGDSSTITNTTTETAFDKVLTIPAGTLKPGRSLRIRFGVRFPSTNSTDTAQLKLRMTNASGTALLTGTAVDIADSETGFIDYTITRRADSSGSPRCVGAGMSILKTTAALGHLTETSIDWEAQQVICVTLTWSVASTSNQGILASGVATLE